MFTVLHKSMPGSGGPEDIFEATGVSFSGDAVSSDIAYGVSAILPDGRRNLIQTGTVFVMNGEGKTVAKYQMDYGVAAEPRIFDGYGQPILKKEQLPDYDQGNGKHM